MFSLEVIWRSAGAYAFARDGDTFTDAGLQAGEPAIVYVLEHELNARLLSVPELLELAAAPPPALELGDSARVLFALIELAQRSVSEGMVHPQLTRGGDAWYAFWGATLDDHIQRSLAEIAGALPLVGAEGFHNDRELTVGDLFPQLVDQIARDRLVAAGVRLGDPTRRGRHTAVDVFLRGLCSPDPELPPNTSYAGLERRLTRWVDDGLAEIKETTWRLGLQLDERPHNALALELWLHADDDETLSLPVSLLWQGGDDAFAFVRSGDPAGDLDQDLAVLRPLLATEGIEFAAIEPFAAELDAETATYFLRELMPQLEQRDVRVTLPAAWLRAPTRLRANVTARSLAPSSGFLSTSVLASFDWRLAVGDTELTDSELRALAAAKSPVVQVEGRWQAVRAADVKRALRFLERRRQGVGFVDLVRAVSGLETDEFGLELGAVHLDRSLDELLSGKDARFRPRGTPKGMRHDLFPFQEKGHGWLRMLGDLGIGAILADDMGLGKTVQAIAMLVSEREEHGRD
ncbi:MAG TPA: SNF2 helicase-associated domain-containing protein, partial [Gaiellaceae bacterium]|nr:SNF2 helicase-associated domain-containing protein [Gaiellaceae bacterium]